MRLAYLFAGATAALAAAAPAADAVYGPQGPPLGATPGGFTQVVTSRVVGHNGGTIRSALAHMLLTVRVPRGAFRSPVQVVIVRPHLPDLAGALDHGRLRRDRVLTGAGVAVTRLSGQSVQWFRRPIGLRIMLTRGGTGVQMASSSSLAGRAVVMRYDEARQEFVRAGFTRTGGVLGVWTHSPAAFAVLLSPRTNRHRVRRSRAQRHSQRGFTG